jgi:hypothetical protein
MTSELAKDLPISLSSVHVTGAPNTRTSFLDAIIRPYIDYNGSEWSTFEDVVQRTSAIIQALSKTDAFSLVFPTLKRSDSIYADQQDVELHLRLRERSR